jgi:patatin-like phospholipase/acyl hydrolase
MPNDRPVLPRSAGTIPHRRIQQPWPPERDFRILALDGGGIRGIFEAAFLAALERTCPNGTTIGEYFDLIAGTSTGGIIALGLGAGKPASEILDLYLRRGCEIFPPYSGTRIGRSKRWFRDNIIGISTYRYDARALRQVVSEFLGDRLFGDSRFRLLIPSFEGRFSEVFVFKTRHHRDYESDWKETMLDVALATSAAPVIFRAHEKGGYRFVDGGVWANNPVMLAVVEALSVFNVQREQIKVLTLGSGDTPFLVSSKMTVGGLWQWRKAIFAAMRLQSHAATNQARLLLGPPNVVRVEPAPSGPPIELDDYCRAVDELLPLVGPAISLHGAFISSTFLNTRAEHFSPIPIS